MGDADPSATDRQTTQETEEVMARPPTGAVVEKRRMGGVVYALRFTACGKRHYVTTAARTRTEAETELANVLADVRRGLWRPPVPPAVEEPRETPSFHAFSSEWIRRREAEGLAEKTLAAFRWSLELHVLPYFADHRLDTISVQEVDRFVTAKLNERDAIAADRAAARKRGERYTERPLSNTSINHLLRHLAQVLETAVEYGLIPSNPASGKRRRLKTTTPSRPWVEPEQVMSLLEAAPNRVGRIVLLLLLGTGIRIGEALALRWRDVDLGKGELYVAESKTEKGRRRVDLSPAVREMLTLWKADTDHAAPIDLVVCTGTGHRCYESNLRRDVLVPAIKNANAKLDELGIGPIGDVTFHSMRRTYATVQRFLEPADYVADQLGHEDSRFTDRVYRQTPRNRRDRLAPAHRREFDRALEWARIGTEGAMTTELAPTPVAS